MDKDQEKEKKEKLKKCIIDESVYNILSNCGDCSAQAITEMLLGSTWAPSWAPKEEVISFGSIKQAIKRLIAQGLVEGDDDLVKVIGRNRQTRKGRVVTTDYYSGDLTWKGKKKS